MKLVSYEKAPGQTGFGAVVEGVIVDFTDLAVVLGRTPPRWSSLDEYVHGLPASQAEARKLLEKAGPNLVDMGQPLGSVRLLAPLLRPAALLDCALTPRHLANSTATLLRRSLPFGLGHVAALFARLAMSRPPRTVRYYKGNHNAVIGDGDTMGWPAYTAYTDIEPELAVITGAIPVGATREQVSQQIAGYLIFNDGSARDVQLPEMFFTGPATCKDFDASKGLGPYLVTCEEIADPLALAVTVQIGDRAPWRGSTAEYALHPLDAVTAIAARQSLRPGTVIGFGTIPDCCGLDRDEWIRPGETIAITIEGLGTLKQIVGMPTAPLPTHWRRRADLTLPETESTT